MQATWKVIDAGDVPSTAQVVIFTCSGCGHDAELPVIGKPIAQLGGGMVFDPGPRAMPKVIECRNCRRRFEVA